tara:strand:- start:3821 stop:4015 length:195 start_codon:yes stop_codon:yes gene_type:complete
LDEVTDRNGLTLLVSVVESCEIVVAIPAVALDFKAEVLDGAIDFCLGHVVLLVGVESGFWGELG